MPSSVLSTNAVSAGGLGRCSVPRALLSRKAVRDSKNSGQPNQAASAACSLLGASIASPLSSSDSPDSPDSPDATPSVVGTKPSASAAGASSLTAWSRLAGSLLAGVGTGGGKLLIVDAAANSPTSWPGASGAAGVCALPASNWLKEGAVPVVSTPASAERVLPVAPVRPFAGVAANKLANSSCAMASLPSARFADFTDHSDVASSADRVRALARCKLRSSLSR